MSSQRKLKRNFSNSEDYDNKPDNFEAETEEFSYYRPKKKKKIWLDSGSESESSLPNKGVEKDDEEQGSASSENEPLDKLLDMSKEKEHKMSAGCSNSENELVAESRISIKESEINEKVHNLDSGCEKNGSGITSEEDEALKTGNLKVYSSSKSSDDEILATKSKRSSSHSDGHKISSNHSLSDKNRPVDTSDDDDDYDDDEPIGKIAKVSKLKRKPKMQNYSSDSSDNDEPLANKNKIAVKNSKEKHAKSLQLEPENKHEKTSDKGGTVSLNAASRKSHRPDTSSCSSDDELDSKPEKNKSEISSEEEPLRKIVKSSQARKTSKIDASVIDSDDEPLVIKNKGSNQKTKSKVEKNQKLQSVGDGCSTSSVEEEPINKIAKGSKKKYSSSSSSDNEPLSTKMAVKQKPKSQNSNLSSDEEENPINDLSKTSKEKAKKRKDSNSSSAKIEHLKKYLRVAGIHVSSYDKLFEGCRSIKSKTEKLLGLLHEKGLKGRPTIEKCKKLKKKIETKKEIAELDISNIIKSEGRPKRGAITFEKVHNTEHSPAAKKFARLRDIIDSEDSD